MQYSYFLSIGRNRWICISRLVESTIKRNIFLCQQNVWIWRTCEQFFESILFDFKHTYCSQCCYITLQCQFVLGLAPIYRMIHTYIHVHNIELLRDIEHSFRIFLCMCPIWFSPIQSKRKMLPFTMVHKQPKHYFQFS